MNPEHLPKITVVRREYKSRRTKAGMKRDGPYWYGYWQQDGKSKRVWIGKELPEALRILTEGRVKKPGYKHYTYPPRP